MSAHLKPGTVQHKRWNIGGWFRLRRSLTFSLTIWGSNMTPTLTKTASILLLSVGALGLSGCATKKFVREQIATVSQRIDGLETRLQATDAVARGADATAKQALAEAQAASGTAANNGRRIDQLNARVDTVEQRVAAQENQRKKARH